MVNIHCDYSCLARVQLRAYVVLPGYSCLIYCFMFCFRRRQVIWSRITQLHSFYVLRFHGPKVWARRRCTDGEKTECRACCHQTQFLCGGDGCVGQCLADLNMFGVHFPNQMSLRMHQPPPETSSNSPVTRRNCQHHFIELGWWSEK